MNSIFLSSEEDQKKKAYDLHNWSVNDIPPTDLSYLTLIKDSLNDCNSSSSREDVVRQHFNLENPHKKHGCDAFTYINSVKQEYEIKPPNCKGGDSNISNILDFSFSDYHEGLYDRDILRNLIILYTPFYQGKLICAIEIPMKSLNKDRILEQTNKGKNMITGKNNKPTARSVSIKPMDDTQVIHAQIKTLFVRDKKTIESMWRNDRNVSKLIKLYDFSKNLILSKLPNGHSLHPLLTYE